MCDLHLQMILVVDEHGLLLSEPLKYLKRSRHKRLDLSPENRPSMESMSTLVLTVVGHATDSQGPRDQGPLGESVMDYSYISCRNGKINGKDSNWCKQAVKPMHDCINMHSSCLNASTLNTRIAQETNVIRAAGPEFPVATSFGTARCASFSYLGINSGKTIFSIK